MASDSSNQLTDSSSSFGMSGGQLMTRKTSIICFTMSSIVAFDIDVVVEPIVVIVIETGSSRRKTVLEAPVSLREVVPANGTG